jgi:tetratricopeptide (TPR) repeat protein
VLARRGIAIRLARPNADPRNVASDLTALAAILDALGDAVAAERCFLRGLRLLNTSGMADGRETAFGLGGLGALYVVRGRYRQGMRLLRRSITLAEAQPGGADPALAVTLNNFALACERLGHPMSAQSALGRALGILEYVLGPDHPSTLACRGNSARAARPSLRSKRGRRG